MPLACLWRTRSSVLGQLHLRPNALAAAGWGAVSLGVTLHTVLHVAPVEVCPCGPASSLPHQYGSCAACIAIDIAAACGGIVTERLGGCGGTSARKAHRRRYDAPVPLAWDQGEMSSREIAHDSDDGVEQAAQSCEPTATRFRRLRDMLAVPLSSRCWITYIAAARLSPIIHRVRVLQLIVGCIC